MSQVSSVEVSVAVIGTGYVGLTTGACLAHLGAKVVCADIDAEKVARLRRGEIPIVEEGLDRVVADGVETGRLSFVVGASQAVVGADVVFLCVPTPQDEDGSADLSYVESAARTIGPVLRSGAVVVNKSTVPVGSAVAVEAMLDRDDVYVVSNPEFLREGTAVQDFLHPDRVVIGGSNEAAMRVVAGLYESLDAPILMTSSASAETIKYAANGFLAMKISFANEVAAMCEAVGADVVEVMAGIGADERIGGRFLSPGPGWGGSCFPKDSKALVSIATQYGYEFALMRSAIEVNVAQRERMVHKIAVAAGRSVRGYRPLAGVVVGLLGLTFKAGTDDLRDSPALDIAERLLSLGAKIQAYDPTAIGDLSPQQRLHLGDLRPRATPTVAAAGADVVAVLTEWPEFGALNLAEIAQQMRGDSIVDTRNVLDPAMVAAAGLRYVGVGRRAV